MPLKISIFTPFNGIALIHSCRNFMFHNPIRRREAIKKSLLLLGAGYGLGSITLFSESCHSGPGANFSFKISSDQEKVIAEIAEVFIPKTDTPGAKDIGLEKFIISFMKDCCDPGTQYNFIQGLNAFKEKAKTNFKNEFWNLSAQDKDKMVRDEETFSFTLLSTIKLKVIKSPASFFQLMKKLSVLGYCTSQEGATEALSYLPIPGRYVPCIPLEPGQKAWALSR